MDNKKNIFSIAIIILGIISYPALCFGVLPLFTGSLGIMFAIIGHRKGGPISVCEIVGTFFCATAFMFSLVLVIYVMTAIVIPIMTDPVAYAQWDEYYRSTLGMGLDEIMRGY